MIDGEEILFSSVKNYSKIKYIEVVNMNIYLISNESFRLINEEIKKIVKGNNYETFNLNKCNFFV